MPREGGGTRRVSVVRQAAWARAVPGRLTFQFQGSSPSRRFAGWSGRRARTSASRCAEQRSNQLTVEVYPDGEVGGVPSAARRADPSIAGIIVTQPICPYLSHERR